MKFEPAINQIRQLAPLLVMFGIVLLWATTVTYLGPSPHLIHDWLQHVMGGFFLLFGGVKLLKLRSFALLFKQYDLVAKHFPPYAYVYPFIEVSLGIAYTFSLFLLAANSLTVVIMSVGAVGIIQKLLTRPKFTCACLGGLFDIPLTWLTVAENLAMAAMAGYMIFS